MGYWINLEDLMATKEPWGGRSEMPPPWQYIEEDEDTEGLIGLLSLRDELHPIHPDDICIETVRVLPEHRALAQRYKDKILDYLDEVRNIIESVEVESGQEGEEEAPEGGEETSCSLAA